MTRKTYKNCRAECSWPYPQENGSGPEIDQGPSGGPGAEIEHGPIWLGLFLVWI